MLNAAGLAVPHWPVEWGGQDWTPLQRHIWREEMQLACVPEPLAFNASMVGPVIAAFGSQEQKERFLPADREPRHLVVPGLLRARRRLRPRLAAHHRRPRRRRLRRQRPEDLDDAGPARRLDLLPGPHRPRRAEKRQRGISLLLVPDGHPRGHAAADRADRRRLRGQRGVLRGRPGARGEPRRRGEPRLGLRQVPARQRARGHRAGSARPSGCWPHAKEHARAITAGGAPLLDDPFLKARIAELENELLALELTALRVVANSADGKPHPASSVLKLRGSELQQAVTELLVDLAGPLSVASFAGDGLRRPGVGAASPRRPT